ncbi:FAD-binding oxidoreductase [Rhodoplanes roseus]|uniref:Hydroxyacid dehydrogenase n=1 Tax=Rhodoplanes roseus TaxID=29409 RepID=A0A327KW32_9BRAD|nr:FAD-binding oxidoreductase [Rhodoplanes roseus]RAI42296.1 hydroxyacid dehydrogenase [Rhodoplanes roseus]
MTMPFRPPVSPEQVARFVAIVGESHAVTDPAEQAAYLEEPRGLYRGRTPAVLRPGTVDEVAAIMALATELGVPVVPQGGNTGLVGGQIPQSGEILVSTKRLDRIREIDPASSTMTVEAGVVLQAAQAAAAGVDRLFPLSLGAEGSCTIGGNLSSNAGGTAALAYGVARDLVLGLEVVLPDGRVWHGLNKLKKDNTGYDLRHLFMGAEGTLGVITAAVLKLFPAPRSIETAFLGLASPEAALALLGLVQERAGGSVTSFELLARICLDMALRHGTGLRDPLAGQHPWYVLIELSSGAREGLRDLLEETLALGIEQGLIVDAVMAESLEHRNAFWRMREFVSDAQRYEGGSIKQDVSVPVAAVPDFIHAASAAVTALIPGCRPVPFGHLGDGNIHFNVSQPVGADKAAFLARWDEISNAVFAEVLSRGGSISAEHGIGVMKRDYLPRIKDPVAMALMRSIKATLDPKGILNPGKVV